MNITKIIMEHKHQESFEDLLTRAVELANDKQLPVQICYYAESCNIIVMPIDKE